MTFTQYFDITYALIMTFVAGIGLAVLVMEAARIERISIKEIVAYVSGKALFSTLSQWQVTVLTLIGFAVYYYLGMWISFTVSAVFQALAILAYHYSKK